MTLREAGKAGCLTRGQEVSRSIKLAPRSKVSEGGGASYLEVSCPPDTLLRANCPPFRILGHWVQYYVDLYFASWAGMWIELDPRL